ncbi:MAG: stage II sporulation protein M [Bacilli bacterium]
MSTRIFKPRANARAKLQQAVRTALFFAVFYAAGVLIGLVLPLSVPHWMQTALSQSVHAALTSRAWPPETVSAAFSNAALQVGMIALIWLLGQSPSGIPLLSLLLFLRAVSCGAAFSLIVGADGWRGVGIDLLALLPSNILFAGGFIIAAAAAAMMTRRLYRTAAGSPRERVWALYHAVLAAAMVMALLGGMLGTVVIPRVLGLLAVRLHG